MLQAERSDQLAAATPDQDGAFAEEACDHRNPISGGVDPGC